MLGNSSAGIMETQLFNIPSVSIGDRQKGRERNQCVIDSEYSDIEATLKYLLHKGKIFNENIYCVDFSGHIVWQIAPSNHVDQESPYTDIKIIDNDIYAYNWDGNIYLVNKSNGSIQKKQFVH